LIDIAEHLNTDEDIRGFLVEVFKINLIGNYQKPVQTCSRRG
jgi:hypothetical protein